MGDTAIEPAPSRAPSGRRALHGTPAVLARGAWASPGIGPGHAARAGPRDSEGGPTSTGGFTLRGGRAVPAEKPKSRRSLRTTRLEAFSDGVFAIASTCSSSTSRCAHRAPPCNRC